MPPLPPSKPTNGATLAVDLSIIIVNWNSADYVRKCIQSIYQQTQRLHFEIIVIDNASYDGCGEMLSSQFAQVRFIQCDQNVGFSRANNYAFRQSRGACVLFLNPDTELVGPAVNNLYQALLTLPDAGAVGAKLLNADFSLQTTCVQAIPSIMNQVFDAQAIRDRFPEARIWGTNALLGCGSKPTRVEAVSGACIMVRRTAFEGVQMFSTEYFMYCEDADLCFKLMKAGYNNYYIPTSEIVHYGGCSSQQSRSQFSAVMVRESIWRFFKKTQGYPYGLAYRGTTAAVAICRLAVLAVLACFMVLGIKSTGVSSPRRKWLAILKWSLGMETWIARHKLHGEGTASFYDS